MKNTKVLIFTLLLLLYGTSSFGKTFDFEETTKIVQSDTTPDFYIQQAKSLFEKAKIYNNSNPDSAAIFRSYVKESLRYYEKANVTTSHAHAYIRLGISMFHVYKLDSAIIYFKQSLKPYQKNDDSTENKLRKQSYLFLTHMYKALGQHDSALVYGHRLVDFAASIKDSATMSDYSWTLGTIYRDKKDIANTIASFEYGGQIAERIGDNKLAYSNYDAAAMSYVRIGDYQKALFLVEKGLKYAKTLNDDFKLAGAFVSEATVYGNLGRFEEAAHAYEQALEYYQKAGHEQMYNATQSALIAVQSQIRPKASVVEKVMAPEAQKDFDYRPDSLIIPGSYQDLKLQVLSSNLNAEDKKVKFEILHQDYLEKQAKSLKQRIWFISILSALVIILLVLLYNRQRQKTKVEAAARRAQEKENEYMSLQKDTELRLIRKYIDGLENERSRISKELHDGICNDLLALEIGLKNNPVDKAELEKLLTFLHETRENIRHVSHELMPPAFQYATIDEILSDYIANLHFPKGLEITYSQSEGSEWNKIPQNIAFEIYRIAQEALGNSLKHAKADKIEVSLNCENNEVAISIRDNGIGFERSEKSKGAGLKIIAERVESIGGKLEISTNKNGTLVKALFNIPV